MTGIQSHDPRAPLAMSDTVQCELRIPESAHLYDNIRANAAGDPAVVRANSHTGQRVVICGAGPSLRAVTALPDADEVWACNSALPYLMDHGLRVTHGVTIDQGEAMLGDAEWGRAIDCEYYVASCAHPDLVAHLRAHGRRITFFHSFIGQPNPPGWAPRLDSAGAVVDSQEMWLYRSLYPESVQVGHGLNSVPRAVCLALAMGFRDIQVYGADCGVPDGDPMPEYGTPAYAEWMAGLVLYADGRTAGACYGAGDPLAEGTIGGRRWHTRADMVISAAHLLELQAGFPGRISYVGDTLPNAMHFDDPEFMVAWPSLTGIGIVSGFGNPYQRQTEVCT
jgi:hypothetical protein